MNNIENIRLKIPKKIEKLWEFNNIIKKVLSDWKISKEEAKDLSNAFFSDKLIITNKTKELWWNLDYETRKKIQTAIWTKSDWKIWEETKNAIIKKSKTQIENNETNNKYTLSKNDFKKYFEWNNFNQENIWNCWLVAIMNSLVNNSNFEEIIRSNIEIKNWIFYINLPLWSPEWKWKIYTVNEEDLNPQKWIYWNDFYLLDWKKWIKALMIAYWKKYTWKDKFDLLRLEWWELSNNFNNLIYWINSYTKIRNYKINNKKIIDLKFLNELETTLNLFSNNDFLTLSVKINSENKKFLPYYYNDNEAHELTVEWIINKNWKKIIILRNSWKDNKKIELTFDELKETCIAYNYWSFNKNINLTEFKKTTSEIKTTSKFNINSKYNISLNKIIEATWNINNEERLSRWDVIIKEKNITLQVIWWWKKDTSISFDENKNSIININNNSLFLDNIIFSNNYKWLKNDKLKNYFYPPRIAVFINKMRHDYIDKKLWNKWNLLPFSLWKNWELLFDYNLEKFSWNEYNKRLKDKIFSDWKINILKDWSLLWISQIDADSKQKIIFFLNQIYNS